MNENNFSHSKRNRGIRLTGSLQLLTTFPGVHKTFDEFFVWPWELLEREEWIGSFFISNYYNKKLEVPLFLLWVFFQKSIFCVVRVQFSWMSFIWFKKNFSLKRKKQFWKLPFQLSTNVFWAFSAKDYLVMWIYRKPRECRFALSLRRNEVIDPSLK